MTRPSCRSHGAVLCFAPCCFPPHRRWPRPTTPRPGRPPGQRSSTSPMPRCRWICSSATSRGRPVKLGDYFQPNRPVLLVMVYFGCPQLCSLSLNGVTKAVRKIDLQPGRAVRDRHRQLQSQRGTRDGRGQEGELHQVAGQARGRRRLALPHQQRSGRRPDAGRRHRFRLPAESRDGAIPAPGGHLSLHARGPRVAGRAGRRSSMRTCSAIR